LVQEFLLSKQHAYSWSEFGREAEFVVALYLRSKGWNIELSKGSRGAADIIATSRNYTKWMIQVKSSSGIVHLKGYEVKRLREVAKRNAGLAIIATLQPVESVLPFYDIDAVHDKPMTDIEGDNSYRRSTIRLGNYVLVFYSLNDWKTILPSQETVSTHPVKHIIPNTLFRKSNKKSDTNSPYT
jgi:Holliday junction resolvase